MSKKRLLVDYLGHKKESNENQTKKKKTCLPKWDQLVKHNIYSFLNDAHLNINQNSESARFVVKRNVGKFNYSSWLHYQNLSIHTKDISLILEVLQSFLLACDKYRLLGEFEFVMINEKNDKTNIIQNLKKFFCKEQFEKLCHFKHSTPRIIKVYELPSLWFDLDRMFNIESYDYLPLKIQNKIPCFSHQFFIDCEFIKGMEEYLLNPRYQWTLDFKNEILFNQLMEKLPLLIEKYKQNQKQLQSLTNEQIYQEICSGKMDVFQFPQFKIKTLTISSDDIDMIKKTMENVVEYFKWNNSPIFKIYFCSHILFEEWIKNSQLANHSLIQRYVLLFDNINWTNYSSQKSKLEAKFGSFLTSSTFQIDPFYHQILSHVSFLSLRIQELMQLWPYIETYDIQSITFDTHFHFITTDVPRSDDQLNEITSNNQENLFDSDSKIKYWKLMTPAEIVNHIEELNRHLKTIKDEMEISKFIDKQLVEFVGWNWEKNWNLQFSNEDIKNLHILKRKKPFISKME